MTIAFLYNIRHHYPNPDDPRTQLEADFDDPKTISLMQEHFRNLDLKLIPIEADEKAYLKLYRHKKEIDLAFNYAEGIYGSDREAQLPAILEMLRIPYTGSKPLTQALVLHKAKTKEILLSNNIPTALFQVFKSHLDVLNSNLKFPLIVKPLSQGSSAGITNKSVVHNKKELRKQVRFILQTFKQPALVESYLQGEEYSVAMLGNPPQILPAVSPNHKLLPKNYQKIDSLEVKWHFEESGEGSNYLSCPAKVTNKTKKQIEDLCRKTWQVLNVLDWCRIDLRADEKGNIFVLEVNSPAGLIPPEISTTSYFPLAARAVGIDYQNLLKMILETAFKRYTHPKNTSGAF